MIVFNSVKCFCCCFHSRIDPTAELKKDSTNEQEKNAAIFLINTLTIHKSQIAIELFRVFHCAMCLLCITTFSVFDFYRLFFFISTRFDHSILIFFLTVSFSFAYMTMGTLYFSNVKFKHSDSIFFVFFYRRALEHIIAFEIIHEYKCINELEQNFLLFEYI